MYNKGSLMLHTLRSIISDDKIWFEIIYGYLIILNIEILMVKI